MKRIMIIGKQGQVSWELQRSLQLLGTIVIAGNPDMDLSNPYSIRMKIREVQPDIIVNAAGYTAVDKAEIEQAKAHAINAVAPGILAEEAKKLGAYLVHFSTDYVFDGTSSLPYKETDPTNPLSIYGKTKLDGEKAILAVGHPSIILRTSWIYGQRGSNFMLTMLALAKKRDHLKVVADQIGAPTWSRMLAQATALLLKRAEEERIQGVYHIAASGKTSWHEFATAIFELNGMKTRVDPITTEEYPTPAKRPKYSLFDQSKLARDFSIVMPDWRQALNLCLQDGINIKNEGIV